MASKTQQVTKAKQTSAATKKTAIRRKYRVRTNLRFFRPSTLQVASKPKYARSTSALKLPGKFDKFSVLVHPLNTEKANKLMTERNTLTFIVHRLANKVQIKKAFNEIHKVKPLSINTLVTPTGEKKAYIRLRPENEAVGVASKMGMIWTTLFKSLSIHPLPFNTIFNWIVTINELYAIDEEIYVCPSIMFFQFNLTNRIQI